MKKNKTSYIIFAIILSFFLITFPVLARLIRDIIDKYKFNFSLVPKNYIKLIAFKSYTYKSFFDYTNPINAFLLVIIAFYILSFIASRFGILQMAKTYEHSENYGSHGTSRWLSSSEIKNYYYDVNFGGWFFGSLKHEDYKIGINGAYHPVKNKSKLNMQVVVVGPPGSDKTTGLVLPVLFNLPYSYEMKNKLVAEAIEKKSKINEKYNSGAAKIISSIYNFSVRKKDFNMEYPDIILTDPKPELFDYTSEYYREHGYDVFVLDFINLKYGDSLNTFDFIDDDKSLMEISKNYVDSVSSVGGGKSSEDMAFWNGQESQVLAALAGFILQKYPKNKQNFTDIAKILTSDDVADIDSARSFFKTNEIKGAPAQLWRNFLMIADSERTRANILGGLAEKLSLFAIEGIQNITSKTTIDISKLGTKKEKPMILYIFMPIEDRTFSPVINVILSTIFRQLYKTARKFNSALQNPVYFVIEEMANIGRLNNIKELLGSMRGLHIYPMMIWQDLSQMKDIYGDTGFHNIMSMCDTKLYLGVNDEFTANYLSNSLGDTTIKVQGMSQSSDGGILPVNKKSESHNYQSRRLLKPEECINFDNEKLILVQRGKAPAKLYKTQYKYWEYQLCDIKSPFSLKEIEPYINDSSDDLDVSNITPVKDIVHELPGDKSEQDKYIDIENNSTIEKVHNDVTAYVTDPNIKEDKSELDNANIDLDSLKSFSDKSDDFDINL